MLLIDPVAPTRGAHVEPHPWVWWVRVADNAAAPDSLYLSADGKMSGGWKCPGGTIVMPLTDDEMRLLGYEKCFCPPWRDVDPDCPAHAVTDPPTSR